ncbi:MAG: hypothetical protein IJM50_05540 [Lachnospiraceae bacterium]|nr:hypothetical protein [Lachnospiraceae bacterium]
MDKIINSILSLKKKAARAKKAEKREILILACAIAGGILLLAGIAFLIFKLVENSRKDYFENIYAGEDAIEDEDEEDFFEDDEA